MSHEILIPNRIKMNNRGILNFLRNYDYGRNKYVYTQMQYLLFSFSGLISKWGLVGGLCRRYRKVQMGPLLLRPIKNKAYDMHGDPKLHEVG